MLEKCKQSQPVIQMIIESTTDDEGTLFEALNLNDELQQVISKFEELEAGLKPGNSGTTEANVSAPVETRNKPVIGGSSWTHDETKMGAFPKGDSSSTECSSDKKTLSEK